jgi:3-hydroxybutyryl-CoA dehydrogenase
VSATPERVVVVGAGTMGHGIAQVAAQAGSTVTLVDVRAELAEAGLDKVRANLDGGVARGKVTDAERDGALARLRASADLAAAAAGAVLVVEAVPERLALKVDVLRAAEGAAPADALLASNTSSLSIGALQDALQRPERVVGMHFFNPVHINRLVEVVEGPRSSATAVDRAQAYARAFGKEPIRVRDSPGFASSRLGVLLGLEAIRMLEEGVASADDIDRALELGYRHPMGPLRLTDLVGLDVRLDIARHLYATLGGERFRPPALLERLVAEGRLGRKSGQGFYDWSEE